jgi:hypothetical protein
MAGLFLITIENQSYVALPPIALLIFCAQVKFLFATIDKCWSLLQPGGFLVVQSMLCKVLIILITLKVAVPLYFS